MLARLRRWRLLSCILLLATPGLGGTVLQVAHPCPVDLPWVAAAEQGSHHGSHRQHGPSGSTTDSATCQCIGTCQVSVAVFGPAAALLPEIAIGDPEPRPRPISQSGDLPVRRPADRLPPSTAPPLA